MTLIEMAHEVYGEHTVWTEAQLLRLKAFAALVAEKEREACAISCEVNAARWVDERGSGKWYAAHECAAAIRARGQK